MTFLAGAVGGAACDQIHVQAGVLSYPHPWLADQGWWVAPQFGVAVCLMLLAATPFPTAADDRRSETSSMVAAAAWFLGAYAASAAFGHHQVALATAYVVTWIVRMVWAADRRPVATWCVLLAIVGTVYEGTLAGTGAFAYAHARLYNVPLWLPGIYLHGAPLAIAVAQRLTRGRASRGRRAGSAPRPPTSRPATG